MECEKHKTDAAGHRLIHWHPSEPHNGAEHKDSQACIGKQYNEFQRKRILDERKLSKHVSSYIKIGRLTVAADEIIKNNQNKLLSEVNLKKD